MPSPLHLRQELQYLELQGSKNLKTFRFLSGSDDDYSNKTFPHLKKVVFPYHAHCCQLQRLAEAEINSRRAARSLVSGGGRERRAANSSTGSGAGSGTNGDTGSGAGIAVCVNLTSLVCLSLSPVEASSINVTWFVDSDGFCSAVVRDQGCSICLDNVCPEECNSLSPNSGNITGDASASPVSSLDVACLSILLSITPTQTLSSIPSIPNPQPFSSSIPVLLSSSVPNPEPQSTPIPKPTSSLQFTILPSFSDPVTTLSSSPSPADSRTTFSTTLTLNRTYCLSSPSSSFASQVISATPLPEMSIDDDVDLSQCLVGEVMAECVLIPPTDPPPSLPPNSTDAMPINCDAYCSQFQFPNPNFFSCEQCKEFRCNSNSFNCMELFPDYCTHCTFRKKRSLGSEVGEENGNNNEDDAGEEKNDKELPSKRVRRNAFEFITLSFEVTLPNFSEPFSCMEIRSTKNSNIINPDFKCEDIVRRDLFGSPVDFINVNCTPGEDPFNPCKDLLGESDGLRAAIWLVIIFALVGNGMVLVVFIGYSVIIRRASQDSFPIHFMYFNLALADLFMGFYLFIIAVIDADTKGDFFLTDIAWRTGHGCEFAGFCAMVSTVVSVYVLLVITIERTYTIVKVFKRKKFTKLKALVVMGAGWLFGIFVAILPVLGVSDYNTVAICLPFNVEGTEDLVYVVLLLLITGIAFFVIAVCYGIIFQQIFCNSNKMSPAQENNRRISDMKIASRIFILIFTNFICWFPIALLGLCAAFGKSLVNNLDFARWAMVFIFPINACLNPFLYSLTTRVFRDQAVLLLSKCGLCKDRAQRIKNVQVGITLSYTSKTSNASSTNGPIMHRLRSFSLVSQTSTVGLLSRFTRRNSTASQFPNEIQQRAIFHNQLRRPSTVSSGSSEDMLNSRRGSTFSAGSGDALLGTTTFSNVGYIATGSLEMTAVGLHAVSMAEAATRARVKISTSSLGAVPEEAEGPTDVIVDQGVIKVNPAYQEEEDMEGGEGGGRDGEKASKWDSGVVEEEEKEDMLGVETRINFSTTPSPSSSNYFQLNVRKSDSSDGEVESGSGST